MKRRVWLNGIIVVGLLLALGGAGNGGAIAQVSAQDDNPIASGQEGQTCPEGVEGVGTPLQQALKVAIEERRALGLPVPSSISCEYDVVTKPQQGTESATATQNDVVGTPNQEITITGKTILHFEHPEQAGHERWPDLVVEDNMPPNATGFVRPGDYTQMVRDSLEQKMPGIWEEYEFGYEPRTYTFEETFVVTYSEQHSEALALISSGALDSTTVEEILMGFTITGPHIDYSLSWDLDILDVTVIDFWAGFVLDWGLGLRLPMEVGLTTPDLMAEGSSHWPTTYVQGLDWSAADFQQAGVAPEGGNEFVMRLQFGLGVFLEVLGADVINMGIPPTELEESRSFETPFGPGSYFQLPSLDVTIWDRDLGVAYLGLGFQFQPSLGSDRVTATWQATGDYSNTGQLTCSNPLSPVQFGPVNAIDGPSQTDILFDEFRYWFTQFLIELSAYIQLEVFGLWDGQFFIPITDIDLSDLTGDLWIGVHNGTTGSVMASIPVANVPPTVQAGPDQAAYEADTISLAPATFTDPGLPDTHTASIAWGDGSVEEGAVSENGGSGMVSGSHVYADDGIYPVTVTVCDDDGDCGNDGFTITVSNVAPQVTATGDTIDENGLATVSGDITDPGTEDTFSVEIDWGEGTPQTYDYAAGTTSYNEQHQYLDDNPTGTPSDQYDIHVTVTDDDGGVGEADTRATVNNVAPQITATGDTIDENGSATVGGTITDPGTEDTFTVEIGWGEGSPQTYEYPAGTTSYSEQHQYLDDNPTGTPSDDYAIQVTVTDDDGGVGEAGTIVTVNNVDPVASIDSIIDESGEEIEYGVRSALILTELDVAGSFTDVGTQDTHEAVWDWGDGSATSPGTVTEENGSGSVSGSHTYAHPGDYTITLTITDDDEGVGTATNDIMVLDAEGATQEKIENLIPLAEDDPNLAAALDKLRGDNAGLAENGALDLLEKGNLNAALEKIKQALQYLEAAEAADPSLDLDENKSFLALTAKSTANEAILQAEAAGPKPNEWRKIDRAIELVAEGDTLSDSLDYVGAVGKYQEAVREVQGIY